MKTEVVKIRIDEALKKKIDEDKEKNCRTFADQVRYIIKSYYSRITNKK